MPAAAAPVNAAARTGGGRWLFGPGPDLLLGCGVAYAFVFVALALGGDAFRAVLPLGLALLPINLVSSAHYGATALRAYERAEDRRRYLFFTVWTTLALGAGFVWGLGSVAVGSWIITLYLTWSPWHYALQNFGVAMTFLRRRGVTVTPGARRALHASFVLSFVLAALALHASEIRASYAPNQLDGGVYSFRALGPMLRVPGSAADAILSVAGVAWLVATAAAVVLLRRGGRARDLAPAFVLVGTQALWFSIPVLARQSGWLQGIDPFSLEHAQYAFLWIGAGHAIQYLWITAYFAQRAGRSRSHVRFVGRSLLAGTALWFVPAALFAPGVLGRLPYDAGLAAMVAALVNLHHFVLDGVIWKLRDSRISRILVGAAAAAPSDASGAPAAETPTSRWRGPALTVAGTLVLFAAVATAVLTELGFNRAMRSGDLDAARRAAGRLETLGQASAEMRLQLGQAYLEQGDLPAATTSLEKSLDLHPTAWAWAGMGDVHARRGEWDAAAQAYARAVELEPDHVVANFHGAVVALEQGRYDRARRGLLRAQKLAESSDEAPEVLRDAIRGVLADPRLAAVR